MTCCDDNCNQGRACLGGMHPQDIAHSLRDLGDEMITIGTWMDYYGGFDPRMVQRGRELVGAGHIAKSWADEILEKVDGGGTASAGMAG